MAQSRRLVAPTMTAGEPEGLDRYREALRHDPEGRWRRISEALAPWPQELSARTAPQVITARLAEPGYLRELLPRLARDTRLALGLIALADPECWPADRLGVALEALGVDPGEAINGLLDHGLAVRELLSGEGAGPSDCGPGHDRPSRLVGHPAALQIAHTLAPKGPAPRVSGPVRQIREGDGLEPVLRLAALWQRVEESPLRRTQHGALYKKDAERLRNDPTISGPVDDSPVPTALPVATWLALGAKVGLLRPEPGTDRIIAVGPEFWSEHGVHLPQMIARRWLLLDEGGPRGGAAPVIVHHEPALRVAALLALASDDEAAWVGLDDLAQHLSARLAGSDRFESALRRSRHGGPLAGELLRWLDGEFLGAAYLLGLLRIAEEDPSGRRVVQLSPLGRYVLGLAPSPTPREPFEKFLVVQPNFEIIAYRQGLNPLLIGQLSRFARWSKLGAALHLELTPDRTYLGLEGGLTPAAMLERLTRHSTRSLPAGVAEAVRSWASRRERVTYHASATLLEFATRSERDQAIGDWPGEKPQPVGDRLILVEADASIPFDRFRLLGARDYRQPPEACIEVEPDGVTLMLDPSRSDLFITAELCRFAEELPPSRAGGASAAFRRRFQVTPATIARWRADGLGLAELEQWFARRTGTGVPPAIRLLVQAPEIPPGGLSVEPVVILRASMADWLDGLVQHPETAGLLGERLGPTAVVVAASDVPRLRRTLADLGLSVGPA
jgi:hypothetical protein